MKVEPGWGLIILIAIIVILALSNCGMTPTPPVENVNPAVSTHGGNVQDVEIYDITGRFQIVVDGNRGNVCYLFSRASSGAALQCLPIREE